MAHIHTTDGKVREVMESYSTVIELLNESNVPGRKPAPFVAIQFELTSDRQAHHSSGQKSLFLLNQIVRISP